MPCKVNFISVPEIAMLFRFRVRTLDAPWSHTFGIECLDDASAIRSGNSLMGLLSASYLGRRTSVQLDLERGGRQLASMTFSSARA